MCNRFKKTTKGTVILFGVSVSTAFAVDYFSPAGIALVGQSDVSQGVSTAKAKNDVIFENWEIQDIKSAKKIYDSKKAIFVDARSRENYEDGHIKGAVSLPVCQFDLLIEQFMQKYPLSQFIVTYCSGRACEDSHRLAQALFEI